jgi:threonylcarbamoyladenosine tRNA methylthiotransferase MtaB
VVRRTVKLEQAGYREVVLTGVNISAWGSEGMDLSGLIREMLAATAATRLRLSSLEPERIGRSLAEAIRHPRVCPHFHLPIQSGSEAVLRRMRRRYRPERVAWAVRLLRESRDEAFLAADILVGFPGETEQDFLATWRLVEELGLARLHVFPFSPRPGTVAWRMKPHIPERIRDERAGRLLDFSDRLLDRYVSRWKGREVEAVLEESAGGSARMARTGAGAPAGDEWIGLTGNYLKARIRGIPPDHAGRGRLVRLLIEETGPTCTGRFLSPA